MAAIDDSMPARISAACLDDTRQILCHAWAHDRDDLKALLRSGGASTSKAQDPKTGETPLHAAIRACGAADPDDDQDAEEEEDGCVEEARDVVRDLFLHGAIWNDVDSNNETPGCVALRLKRNALYNLCVEAGVRAELLFALVGDYETLSSGPEDEDEEIQTDAPAAADPDAAPDAAPELVAEEPKFVPPTRARSPSPAKSTSAPS